jgi:non-specific serine/threonine protein kinase
MLDSAPNNSVSFGAFLRKLRLRAGLNKKELGDLVGYSNSLIGKLEKDERLPDVDVVRTKFARALNIEGTADEPQLIDLAVSAHLEDRTATIGDATLRNAAPLNKFVGRRKEMELLVAAMGEHRLVTLCGPGGCGKTRLAIETAQALRQSRVKEAWFIDLSDCREPADILHEIASSLHVGLKSSDPILGIVRFFAQRHVLMVIDNAEHVIQPIAATVNALLHECPNLRILVTSREPLRLYGEFVWRLPPLNAPQPTEIDALAGDALRQFEAVELFLARARLADARVATHDDAALRDMAHICWRLDGLPLAIELAAAQTSKMSVNEILNHMDNRFAVLTQGIRIAPGRQMSLEQAIDWSHVLLTPNAQRVFRRLAVFAGGWSSPMATAVCADEDCTPQSVMAGISELIDKSMVVHSLDESRQSRYSMLETLRAYAMLKLEQAGERAILSDRHARYMVELVEETENKLFGSEQTTVLRSHAANLGNIRAALARLIETGDYTGALQMAGALRRFWQTRGHVAEGRMWLSRALVGKAHTPENIRARAVFTAAVLADYQGDVKSSQLLNDEAMALAQRSDDPWLAGQILSRLVYREDSRELTDESRRHIAQAYEDGLRLNNPWLIGNALHKLAAIEIVRNNIASARDYLVQSDWALAQTGDGIYVSLNLVWLGVTSLVLRDDAQARHYFYRALSLMKRTGFDLTEHIQISYCLQGLADLAAIDQQPERMARLLGAVEAERETLGGMANHWFPNLDAGAAEERYAQLSGSTADSHAFHRAWALGRQSSLPESVEEALGQSDGIEWLDEDADK